MSPDFSRVNGSRHGVAELDIVVADGVAADDGAFCFFHFIEAAADYLLKDRWISFFRKANNRKGGDGFAAHGVNVAERIGGGDLAEREWVVDNRCEKIHGLHQREIVVD